MGNGLTRETRLQIMLTEDELRALDDWRFKFRLPSRASAIRELLKNGLAAERVTIVAVNGSRGKRSADFGVIDAGSGGARKKPGIGSSKAST